MFHHHWLYLHNHQSLTILWHTAAIKLSCGDPKHHSGWKAWDASCEALVVGQPNEPLPVETTKPHLRLRRLWVSDCWGKRPRADAPAASGQLGPVAVGKPKEVHHRCADNCEPWSKMISGFTTRGWLLTPVVGWCWIHVWPADESNYCWQSHIHAAFDSSKKDSHWVKTTSMQKMPRVQSLRIIVVFNVSLSQGND